MVELNDRLAYARELHKTGYNCAQCVALAFADLNPVPESITASLAAGFGGGVGGQGEVCGAVSGMAMVAGAVDWKQPADKKAVYSRVAGLTKSFAAMNDGLIRCCDLRRPGRKPCILLIEDAVTTLHNALEAD